MQTIDVRGIDCPQPIILTREALEKNLLPLLILVDNDIPRKNLTTYLTESGYMVSLQYGNLIVGKISESDLDRAITIINSSKKIESETIVVLNSIVMGYNDELIGKTLLSSFLTSLLHLKKLPNSVFLYNEGALLIKNKATKQQLLDLKKAGINIKICGMCVNYYSLEEEVKEFKVTNMLSMLEAMFSNHIIKP
jgi:selenium metabolism protein YedF